MYDDYKSMSFHSLYNEGISLTRLLCLEIIRLKFRVVVEKLRHFSETVLRLGSTTSSSNLSVYSFRTGSPLECP